MKRVNEVYNLLRDAIPPSFYSSVQGAFEALPWVVFNGFNEQSNEHTLTYTQHPTKMAARMTHNHHGHGAHIVCILMCSLVWPLMGEPKEVICDSLGSRTSKLRRLPCTAVASALHKEAASAKRSRKTGITSTPSTCWSSSSWMRCSLCCAPYAFSSEYCEYWRIAGAKVMDMPSINFTFALVFDARPRT